MGRPKKPTALKILAGNPGHRPLNKKEPKPALLAPVPFLPLEGEAKKAWEKLAPMLFKIRVLTEADTMALTVFCQVWADYCRARSVEDSIKNDLNKFIAKSANGALYQNPIRGSINTLIKMLDQLMTRFGLNPQARSNIMTGLDSNTFDENNEFAEFLK